MHEKGVELACDLDPDVPEWVVGDRGRLAQVIINLVGNAVKFTERGEVVIVVGDADSHRERASSCTFRFETRASGSPRASRR